MIRLTKKFHFETAHAIHGYQGACKNIHGHSYELHVTVNAIDDQTGYIPAPGFVIDFKTLKRIVMENIIDVFDHSLVLSTAFLKEHPSMETLDNLIKWEVEPSAENLLIYIREQLKDKLPKDIQIVQLRLYETNDSYAEWINDAR